MKRIIAILCAALCILCLTACAGTKVTRAGLSFTVPDGMTIDDGDPEYPDTFSIQADEAIGSKFIYCDVTTLKEAEESVYAAMRFLGEENFEKITDKKIGNFTYNGFTSTVSDYDKTYIYATLGGDKAIYINLISMKLDDKKVNSFLTSLELAE